MNNYTLTFEITPQGDELQIHATKEGLEKLKKEIEFLLEKKQDHTHLMTPSWGGHELTEDIQSDENKIINHVKIFKWE